MCARCGSGSVQYGVRLCGDSNNRVHVGDDVVIHDGVLRSVHAVADVIGGGVPRDVGVAGDVILGGSVCMVRPDLYREFEGKLDQWRCTFVVVFLNPCD